MEIFPKQKWSIPSRMSTGSLRPAFAKSTSIFGNVALNMTICFDSGSRFSVSLSCSPNPISKSRSASSKTTYSAEKSWKIAIKLIEKGESLSKFLMFSHENWKIFQKSRLKMHNSPIDDNFKSISTHKCRNRPGVATMTSGHVCIAWNCELIGSPPSTRIVCKSMYLPISLMNLNVCTANSRVGDKINALAFVLACRAFSFSNIGIKKHAVLPEPKRKHYSHQIMKDSILDIFILSPWTRFLPVLAIATTFLPSKIIGMVFLCTGVGNLYPRFSMPFITG